MKALKADIAIIGAGSGGLSVAAGAAQLGLKVVLFEKGEMGGDCLNTGCVPSKALIAAAKTAHLHRTAGRFGVRPSEPTIDWSAVRTHVDGVIETIAPIDSQERFEGLGVTVIREHARFAGRDVLVSDGARVRAKRIVIAAGSTARVPDIPGLREAPYLTNETIFRLEALPRRLAILGGGPIGIELGQAFRRLGAEVVVIEAERALARADAEAAEFAIARLRAEGVDILEQTKATAVARTASGGVAVTVESGGAQRTIEASHLLVALGRAASVAGLDLEAGGVAHSAQGVTVKPNLRSVSNPRVWAVGDVTGQAFFTHAAGWHASVFVRNALFKAPTRADGLPMPSVTYCDPEVAQIGLTEAEARARLGEKARVARWSFHENDRAQTERHAEGFAKIITDVRGRILGASIVGEGAGDLLQIAAVAMSNGLTIRALTNLIAPYPTRGEIIKRVAGQWYVPALFSPRTKALVRLLSHLP